MGIFTVPVAAALWCGVSGDEVQEELAKAKEEPAGKEIYKHPYIPCLKPKCMILHAAIQKGELPHSRENGIILDGGEIAAPTRRYISGKHLREYILKYFPDDRPATLFSEQERKSIIDLAEYNRMNAEYIKLKTDINELQIKLTAAENLARDSEAAKLATYERIEKAKKTYRQQKNKIVQLEAENEQLRNTPKPINDRESLLNIIATLKEIILDKTEMADQAALINFILDEYKSRGLSESNLKAKFAEANRLQRSN